MESNLFHSIVEVEIFVPLNHTNFLDSFLVSRSIDASRFRFTTISKHRETLTMDHQIEISFLVISFARFAFHVFLIQNLKQQKIDSKIMRFIIKQFARLSSAKLCQIVMECEFYETITFCHVFLSSAFLFRVCCCVLLSMLLLAAQWLFVHSRVLMQKNINID